MFIQSKVTKNKTFNYEEKLMYLCNNTFLFHQKKNIYAYILIPIITIFLY